MEAGQCQQGKIWSHLLGAIWRMHAIWACLTYDTHVQVQKGMQGIDTRIINPKVKGTASMCF